MRRLAVRLAQSAGRRLDAGSPFVDARLAGGVRLHAVLPPVAVSGVHLSLRVHRANPLDLPALLAAGSLHPSFEAVLNALIAARLAFVISGGAGTGKTTLLGALLARADPAERILVVEDTAELTVDHPHVVRLSARPPNVEGAGEITLRDLVRQALRMRPDRVIVGEVRGAELLDMLLAGNTGHDGGLTTLHANGVSEVPARVEALAMLDGVPRAAAHSLLAAALRVAVHLQRTVTDVRRVAQIAVLERDGRLGAGIDGAVLGWGSGRRSDRVPAPRCCAELAAQPRRRAAGRCSRGHDGARDPGLALAAAVLVAAAAWSLRRGCSRRSAGCESPSPRRRRSAGSRPVAGAVRRRDRGGCLHWRS